MKITRKINGTTYNIELLPDEVCEAYYEQRDKFDVEDIINYGEMMSSKEIEEELGCTYSEFLSLKEEMAQEMRRNIDKYGMDFPYARTDAVNTVIRRNKVVCN